MITEEQTLLIDNEKIKCKIDRYTEEDREKIIEIYDSWKNLSKNLNQLNCRKVNFPEISEVIFCYVYDCWRTNNLGAVCQHSSFDCYNPKTDKTLQIKATSIDNDLTSFGPKSVWDELYFMDFYNEENGNLDYNGDFKVYLIPNDEIYNRKLNKGQTFIDQQKQGRRPRFGIKKEIIKPLNLKPIDKFNIYEI